MYAIRSYYDHGFASIDEAILLVHVYSITGALVVPLDDFDQGWEELDQQSIVTGRFVISPYRLHKPQAGICRVVFGRLAFVGETIWHHAMVYEVV